MEQLLWNGVIDLLLQLLFNFDEKNVNIVNPNSGIIIAT
jgi:hypothetical protein